MNNEQLDQALRRHFARNSADAAAAARVMAKLAGPLPRQKRATLWPPLLLDRQFSPAWPRMAALAGCVVLGFIVGHAGVDHLVAPGDSTDLALVAFEPDPLTGLQP